MRYWFSKGNDLYKKYERHISSFALIVGFIFDNLTFRDASLSSQNIVFVSYILLAGMIIVFLHIIERREENFNNLHFWTVNAFQFILGNIFSSLLVFYSRGVSLQTSWPFLLILFLTLIGNEIFKKHFIIFSARIWSYFFVLLSFSMYFVPIIFKSVSVLSFVMANIVSVALIYLFVYLLYLINKEKVLQNKKIIISGIAVIVVVINILYFTKSIPPIPIALKQAELFHNLRFDKGNYSGEKEKNNFLSYFGIYKTIHITSGEPVYLLTGVFAPPLFRTNIIHEWQYYDDLKNRWVTASSIAIPVVGGREAGYRGFSFKQQTFSGLWRVNVLTPDKRFIGRVTFWIKMVSSPVPYHTVSS